MVLPSKILDWAIKLLIRSVPVTIVRPVPSVKCRQLTCLSQVIMISTCHPLFIHLVSSCHFHMLLSGFLILNLYFLDFSVSGVENIETCLAFLRKTMIMG